MIIRFVLKNRYFACTKGYMQQMISLAIPWVLLCCSIFIMVECVKLDVAELVLMGIQPIPLRNTAM